MSELCVCCTRPAATDIEVGDGLWVGVCSEHLARRTQAEARRRASGRGQTGPTGARATT
jgi:hypothetical protein